MEHQGNHQSKESRKNRYKGKKDKFVNKNVPVPISTFVSVEEMTNKTCPLCKENNAELAMPCAGMHSYCFSCIKKWLVNKKELTCPECRKICENVIKLPISKDKLSSEFLEFLESVKIIPNPLKHDEDCKCFQTYFENTCIYPNWTIIHFIENKEQLELYYETIESPKYKDKNEELIKIIKWFTISDEDEKPHRRHGHGHSHHDGHLTRIIPN
jgi:hypothetical protein